ncbi:hypothetical protein CWM63_14715 [Klebsiella sp. F-Nf9]|nr:hypothetical protein CWM63_14715 [Klebsiella sp. F-Nf9]PKJ70209.1 hypothetical protein CW267_13215 [Klebsiella sp. X1-16S-Nf21]
MKLAQNSADRSSLPCFTVIILPYLAVCAEIYCLAKLIIYIYSFRTHGRRSLQLAGSAYQRPRCMGLAATSRCAGKRAAEYPDGE